MMSMTLGSLVGAVVLGSGMEETYFYIILASMGFIASISFLFIRKPLKQDPIISHTAVYESVLTTTPEL